MSRIAELKRRNVLRSAGFDGCSQCYHFAVNVLEESFMAVLTIRNLPDTVRDRLRKRAAAAGMSMEAQARAILAKASLENVETETGASLQKWVDRLYRGDKPEAAVKDLLAARRSEVRVESKIKAKPSVSIKTRK
jgi:plasmid stability protein